MSSVCHLQWSMRLLLFIVRSQIVEAAYMKIAYLPIRAALLFMLVLMSLPDLVAATGGPGNSARATRSAVQQLAQDESDNSADNPQADQPDSSAATNDNSDQSSAQPGDENGAS